MVAILELGTEETEAFFHSQAGQQDAVEVLLAYADHEADNAQDPRAVGFLHAVVVAASSQQVSNALAEHQRHIRAWLAPWVRRAREQGTIRIDLPVERIVNWLLVFIDGFASQVADGSTFDARLERGTLREAIRRFLAP